MEFQRPFRIIGLLLLIASPDLAWATPEEDYQKRLERAKPDEDPKQHRTLATWCARNFPEKAEFHQNAFNEHEFKQIESGLPSKPTAADYKRIAAEAEKLGQQESHQTYLAKWGEMQFEIHAQKVQPGDIEKMKMLLKWCVDERISFIPPALDLASKIVEVEPDHDQGRTVLGHLKIDGKWQSMEEALAGIDIRDPAARVALHRKLHDSAAASERVFPANPFRGMEKAGNYHLTSTKASNGEAKYLITESGYSRNKPAALVIALHGGGSGGYERARPYAGTAIGEWSRHELKGGLVAIAPIARKHVTNSWGTLSNVEDLIDAIEDTIERFNIDRKRIYITGQSMGGGGTSLYYLCLPELAAAYCARAGFYFRDPAAKDVLGKPILIIHGEKDEGFRNTSRDEVVEQINRIGGVLTDVRLPDTDHFIRAPEIMPRMIPFFDSHVNDIEPDFRLIRAAARAWFKN